MEPPISVGCIPRVISLGYGGAAFPSSTATSEPDFQPEIASKGPNGLGFAGQWSMRIHRLDRNIWLSVVALELRWSGLC